MALRAADRHDVLACARRPVERLVLEQDDGDVDLPLRIVADPAAAVPADWVMLCTKAHQTASAAPWLARLCGPDTRVAVLQNGIDHAARTSPYANSARVGTCHRLLQRGTDRSRPGAVAPGGRP